MSKKAKKAEVEVQETAVVDQMDIADQLEAEMAQAEAAKAESAAEVQAEVSADAAPAEAEVANDNEVLTFASVKKAAEYIQQELNINFLNAVDGIYKSLRRGTRKTHGYIVCKYEDHVTLQKIKK